ncbi:kinetochore-associated protein NSL1 homolog [Scleropages formosus]|uniref:NSL1 component of MIS12 kinetochore complex n=1 Tax=Scleropages formosus TaxID=113540 RepID=A0A8C9RSV2_SCLFO|nr:kinetochore-associated protein NSL1 homolog [Scleropages formosus]
MAVNVEVERAGVSNNEEMGEEQDYRVKIKSKAFVREQLHKCNELLRNILDEQSSICDETKRRLLKDVLESFERGVQENVVVNGESWEEAADGEEQDAGGFVSAPDCKALDDMLDENILETTLKRSRYPKKILPYVVRSLKAQRETMSLYEQAIKPQKTMKDPIQGAIMSDLSESAPRIIRQSASVMKALQSLQQKAEGLRQVMALKPSAESLEVHRDVFGRPSDTEGRPALKRPAKETELSGAYVLKPKRSSTQEENEDPQKNS